MNFIELHSYYTGEVILINLDLVTRISSHESTTSIEFKTEVIEVNETINQIQEKIALARQLHDIEKL